MYTHIITLIIQKSVTTLTYSHIFDNAAIEQNNRLSDELE